MAVVHWSKAAIESIDDLTARLWHGPVNAGVGRLHNMPIIVFPPPKLVEPHMTRLLWSKEVANTEDNWYGICTLVQGRNC